MNTVILYQRPNNTFELEINSLTAKTDFTSAGFPAIVGEVSTYLLSTEGQERLSGVFNDVGDPDIVWNTLSPDPTAFDGSNAYRIKFIKQTV